MADIPKWKGIQALQGLLKLTGGWPVLEGRNWKSWPHNWTKQLAIMFNKTGMNAVIMELAVTQDPKNSSRNVIEVYPIPLVQQILSVLTCLNKYAISVIQCFEIFKHCNVL